MQHAFAISRNGPTCSNGMIHIEMVPVEPAEVVSRVPKFHPGQVAQVDVAALKCTDGKWLMQSCSFSRYNATRCLPRRVETIANYLTTYMENLEKWIEWALRSYCQGKHEHSANSMDILTLQNKLAQQACTKMQCSHIFLLTDTKFCTTILFSMCWNKQKIRLLWVE